MEPTIPNRIGDGFDVTAMTSKLMSLIQIYWFPFALLMIGFGIYNLARGSTMVAKFWRNLEENVFHNWRLVLLGITGLVLSVASGWTTWDGMRNFTHEPILSLLITFGIQGVMLIAAWLIGESFATGMSQRTADGAQSRSATETTLGTAIGVLLFIAVASWAMRFLSVRETLDGVQTGINWGNVANGALVLVIAMLALASMMVNRNSEVVMPYLQGSRVMAKNAVLWLMFLACMGTSVFFSFDSLFSNIFPQSERARAAQIRTTNQVAGIVADIGSVVARRRISAAEQLFQTPEWDGYEQQLTKISALAETAPGLIRDQIRRELEDQNRQVEALQEKRANATSSQAGLSGRKTQVTEEISRLKSLRPAAMNDTLGPKTKVALLTRELEEQRVKTLAEERGVEGSLKVGRGPKYRASKDAEDLFESRLEVARQRSKTAVGLLQGIDREIANLKAELAQIDGDLAKLKGEAATAEQLIAVAKSNNAQKKHATFDPAVGLAQLDRELQSFHQAPTSETLARIQSGCGTIHSAMMRVDSLVDRAAKITCDPGQASEAASVVFALNAGVRAFEANCAGGDRLPQGGGTDAMLHFGRKCLQDSGLPSTDTAALGSKLSSVELSRDDKAHRFVVTWNAFQDGNSLAYLALAIAIAIDALVFMSGLFGANVVRSPLSDIPSPVARTAKQLDAIIDSALLPDRYETADLVLGAMHGITEVEGFSQEVILSGNHSQHDDRIRKVLSAGAGIGAVRRLSPHHYQVHSELRNFLAEVKKREFDSNSDHAKHNELEKLIEVALLPDVCANSETTLSYMHPIDEKNGFTSEIYLQEIDPLHIRAVRSVLNAGSTMQVVQRDSDEEARYYIHADLYRSLARIRARTLFNPPATSHQQVIEPPPVQPTAFGGDITEQPAALPDLALPHMLTRVATAPPEPDHQAAPRDQGEPNQVVSLSRALRDEQARSAVSPSHETPVIQPPALIKPVLKKPEPPIAPVRPVVQRPASPQPSMQPIDDGAPADFRMLEQIRNQLTRPLGMTAGAYGKLINSGILENARSTIEALQGLDHRAPKLWSFFEFELSDKRETLTSTLKVMRNEHRDNNAYQDTLTDVAREVNAMLAPIMLSRGGPYERILDDLLQRMEGPAGEGKLSNREEAIYLRLQAHKAGLQNIERESPDDWKTVAQLISQYDENVSIVEPVTGTQRIN